MESPLLLNYILEFAMVIPAAVMALIPVRRWFRLRPVIVFSLVAACASLFIVAGAFTCAAYNLPSNVLIIPSTIPFFLLFCLFLKDMNISKRLFCFLNATMLCAFCNTYTGIISAPWEQSNYLSVFLPPSSIVCLGVATVVFCLFARTLIVKLPMLLEQESIDGLWKWYVLGPLAVAVLLLWASPQSSHVVMMGRIRPVSLALGALGPIIIWTFFHIAWWTMSRMEEGARLRRENELLRIEEQRYVQLRGYVDETRALRHDFRHHLLVIDELIRSGQTEKLDSYIRQLMKASETDIHSNLCANKAVDAIASHYDALAKEQGVDMEWLLALPETTSISEIDLCALIGNLVENAVKAAMELPEEQRTVEVKARAFSESIYTVAVQNPHAGHVDLGSNGLPLAKESGHGIGLASVEATVKKYRGTIDVKDKDGILSIVVLLYAND